MKARLPSPLASPIRSSASSVSVREVVRPAARSAASCWIVGFVVGLAIGLLFLLRAVLHQILDHARIGESRGVAEIAEIVLGDLAQDAAHDLAGARLGQARRPLDDIGPGDRADLLAHPAAPLLPQAVA